MAQAPTPGTRLLQPLCPLSSVSVPGFQPLSSKIPVTAGDDTAALENLEWMGRDKLGIRKWWLEQEREATVLSSRGQLSPESEACEEGRYWICV